MPEITIMAGTPIQAFSIQNELASLLPNATKGFGLNNAPTMTSLTPFTQRFSEGRKVRDLSNRIRTIRKEKPNLFGDATITITPTIADLPSAEAAIQVSGQEPIVLAPAGR
jgi:hypothetical protein